MFAHTTPVTVNVRNMPIFDYLNLVLEGQHLGYRVVDRTIMLEPKPTPTSNIASVTANQQPIHGVVMGLAGEQRVPLAGATIALNGRYPVVSVDGGNLTGRLSANH